jgi:FkbM family methyltransferase
MYPMLYYGLIKKPEVVFTTKTNRLVKIRTNATDLMAFTHVWLIQEYFVPGFEINKNDVVIDVGGHIGLFSIYASQFCTDGKIFCYEPIKENFNLLIENIELNHLQNVHPFNTAVSKSIDEITIYLNDDEAGHSMFLETANYRKAKSTTLTKIFSDNNIDKCNFLKLDCEGAEYEIIDTTPPKYFDKIDKMIIEYHMADTKPQLLENLKNKLYSLSYSLSSKPLCPDIGFLYAIKQ